MSPSPDLPRRGPFRVVQDAARTPDDLRGATLLLGNFDGFHLGHQTLLTAGRGASGTFRTPLGVMSCEPHPKTFFAGGVGAFRLTTPADKEAQIRRLGFDFHYRPVFDAAFAGLSPEAFVRDVLAGGLRVAHVICGGDFRFGHGRAGDVARLTGLGQEVGITVTVMARADLGGARISSSRIRAALAEGQLGLARALLGRFWSFHAEADASGGLALPPDLAQLAAGTYHALWRADGDPREHFGTLSVRGKGQVALSADQPFPHPLLEITPVVRVSSPPTHGGNHA